MLGILNRSTLPALEQTVAFAQRRHSVLAGNVANLDTPGYQARDISTVDFQSALSEAIDAVRSGSVGSVGDVNVDPMDGPKKVMENLLYHDGSEVNLERQVTELAKNQHMHNTAIALMRNQFSVLQVAISERV